MGGSIAEPRLPQTHKCINTDDREKLYKKNLNLAIFQDSNLYIISTRIIKFGLSFNLGWRALNVMVLLAPRY